MQNEQSSSTNKQSFSSNKDIASVFVVTAAILMVPLVAMQFSDEWDWNVFDFAVIGTLLIGTGLLIVLVTRKVSNTTYKAALVIALVAALLLIWAELAVGVFGTPFAGS